ncbi:hypothetical protein I4U23_027148 [Adineta vaga]|nr:hypothetical protein I4U23_027148 [Adineta vaga]
MQYNEIPASNEQATFISEETEGKQQSAKKSVWSTVFSHNKMKIIITGLVFVFVVTGAVMLFTSSQLQWTNEPSFENDQGDALPQLRSYSKHERHRSPDSLGHMNIYINKHNHRSNQRLRFPVARYDDRRHFPLRGPFLNFMPWIPIFADRLTKQTIVYSPTGVYILPPLINSYGQLFSVAQLIASGYASLVSSGSSPYGNIDMLRYFQPQPLLGPGIPVINPLTGGFTGGIYGNFGSFPKTRDYEARSKMDYSRENEDDDDNYHRDEQQESEEYKYRPQYNSYRNNRKPYKTNKITRKTTPSTTKSSPLPSPQSYLTKCEPEKKSRTNDHKGRAFKKHKLRRKMRMLSKSKKSDTPRLLRGAYVIQYPANTPVKKCFQSVTDSLQKTHGISRSLVKTRLEYKSSLFAGISIQVDHKDAIDALEMIEDAIELYPVTISQRPRPKKNSAFFDRLTEAQRKTLIPHYLTGVDDIHKRFKNFGEGVKIGMIDTGIDYTHPALGGCFGGDCKVAFGYDLVGDAYDGSNTPEEDDDPMDNCSEDAHGTHVAGIIGANTTGIDQPLYTPFEHFIGVAPRAKLGAYRVFGCSGYVTSDVVAKAIYRAYDDGMDIITLSLGGLDAYRLSVDTIAAQLVSEAGAYITISAGNDGTKGLYSTQSPAIASGAMTIGSIDNKYQLTSIIITPNGKQINYSPGFYGGWTSNVTSKIVVNDPNRGLNDGCNGINNPTTVIGAVVLFSYNVQDTCSSFFRCNAAAEAHAIGCLMYDAGSISGSNLIPSGSMSLTNGLSIVITVAKNPSALYTFTGIPSVTLSEKLLTPSYFTSLGPTGDLDFYTEICAIGGFVYSTVSPSAATISKVSVAYNTYSGTSMSSPYMAGVLALFLSNINNPPPYTVNGTSSNGKCRPKFSLVKDIFQSNAQMLNIHSSSLLASAIQQGAGLVQAMKGITTTTLVSPSTLSLNDTVRKHSSYKVSITNIGNTKATYEVNHVGAALVTGATSTSELLLLEPIYSEDYSKVTIQPSKFQLQPGHTQKITLRFQEPSRADPTLLPVYSGYINVQNTINNQNTHVSYAGVVGDYSKAQIIVRNSDLGPITGIQDVNGAYVTNGQIPTLKCTEGCMVIVVLAYPTRLLKVEAISTTDNTNHGVLYSAGTTFSDIQNTLVGYLYAESLPRNLPIIFASYEKYWYGEVGKISMTEEKPDGPISKLADDQYTIQFSVLRHFGDPTNPSDYEVYQSPPFNLVQ